MRISLPWVIAFLGVSLAGVSVDAARAKPGRSLVEALQGETRDAARRQAAANRPRATSVHEVPLEAALVLHADDCAGNFRMFNLLHRADVRTAIGVAVIWYVGASSDSARIRGALPSWMHPVALAPVPRDVVRELARLGHRTTPVLLMLDAEGRLRFSSQSPRSAREFAGLQRIITGLTWNEDR